MKKTLVTSVAAFALAGAALAQGVVSWSTITPTFMTAQTNSTAKSPLFGGGTTGSGAVGATAATGGGFYYALLYNTAATQQSAPQTLSALDTWQFTGLTATNNTGTAGRLTCVAPTTAATVPWSQGVSNSIMLVGWSANLGTTWGAVSNVLNNWNTMGASIVGSAFFGVSATGYLTPNTSPASGATLWGSAANANGIPINSANTQLYLIPVPEPGTIALACLGGASLLLFRRRK